MTELHVLRVFLGPDGRNGNPLGVFLDGSGIPPERRHEVARDLNFSDALTGQPPPETSFYAWAWIDEGAGILRSRYFADGIGIVEDEATGAAAVLMGDRLGRPLTIRQGRGSELHVRPGPDGLVEVGGRVTLDEIRRF